MDRNRMLKSYGHKCNLSDKILKEKFEVQYPKTYTRFSKMWNRIRMTFLISDMNRQAVKYCRSEHMLYLQRKRQMSEGPNIIHPLSPFRSWWEIIMIVNSFCVLLFLPFCAAFTFLVNISNVYQWRFFPRIIFDLICVMDIFVNFNTGYYDEDRVLVLDRKLIAKNYLRKFFIFDALSSIPPVSEKGRTSIARPLKILRLFSCIKYMNNFAKLMHYKIYATQIFFCVVIGIIMCHWLTCLSIIVALDSVELDWSHKPLYDNWITNEDLWNSSVTNLYAIALYRTACLVSLSEYDIYTDHTRADQILACIVWISAKFFHLLVATLLVQLTRSMRSSETKYKEMLCQLMQYMQHKQLSSYTQKRFISFYEFRFQKIYFNEREILNTISLSLRQEILMFKCLRLVKNVPFFKGLPQSILLRIVMALQLEIFLSDDVVFKANSKGSCMYFIVSGTVAGYSKSGVEVFHLHDGEYFGYVGITRNTRLVTIVAIEPCELYRLDRKHFVKIVESYPELLQALEYMAWKRIQLLKSFEDKFRHFRGERRRSLAFSETRTRNKKSKSGGSYQY